MKTNYGKILTVLVLVVFTLGFMSLTSFQDPSWKAPEKYKTMKNPVKATDASKATGKSLYMKNCASCH